MAMNVGTGGGSSDPDVMIDINTTPLIDVMLVLLVMLIITIPIQLHSVNLNMPTGNPPPPLVKPEVVKIDIDASRRDLLERRGRAGSGRRSRTSSRSPPSRRSSPRCTCGRTRRPSTRSSPW